MHYLLPLPLAVLFAVLFHFRGGWIPTGSTQLARASWAIPVGIAAAVAGGHLWIMPVSAALAFGTLLYPPQSPYQDTPTIRDAGEMSLIEAYRFAVSLAPAAIYHPLIILVAPLGLLAGIFYYIGNRFWPTGLSFLSIDGHDFFAPGLALGEIGTGALFGFGLGLFI